MWNSACHVVRIWVCRLQNLYLLRQVLRNPEQPLEGLSTGKQKWLFSFFGLVKVRGRGDKYIGEFLRLPHSHHVSAAGICDEMLSSWPSLRNRLHSGNEERRPSSTPTSSSSGSASGAENRGISWHIGTVGTLTPQRIRDGLSGKVKDQTRPVPPHPETLNAECTIPGALVFTFRGPCTKWSRCLVFAVLPRLCSSKLIFFSYSLGRNPQ